MARLTNAEKVIKGLESLYGRLLDAAKRDSIAKLDEIVVSDALALLKAQEPRVMTPEEIISVGTEDICGIVEIIEEEHMYGCYMRRYDEGHVELCCDVLNIPEKMQKGCARIWTARPTDEQRKAVKWE